MKFIIFKIGINRNLISFDRAFYDERDAMIVIPIPVLIPIPIPILILFVMRLLMERFVRFVYRRSNSKVTMDKSASSNAPSSKLDE